MNAQDSQARRAAFLAALAETGNQTLAAERAGVTRGWVGHQRRSLPEFGIEVVDALARWAARLDADRRGRGKDRWLDAGVDEGVGGDQVGRTLTVQAGNRRFLQVARAKPNQWSPAVETRFLAVLANGCNVARACDAVGLTRACAYGHKKRWPDFAKRWDQAIEDGYDALSLAMVAAAGAMLGDTDKQPEPEMGMPTVDQAIEALRLQQRRMRGESCRRGWRRRPRPLEEIRASILRQVAIVARANLPPDP